MVDGAVSYSREASCLFLDRRTLQRRSLMVLTRSWFSTDSRQSCLEKTIRDSNIPAYLFAFLTAIEPPTPPPTVIITITARSATVKKDVNLRRPHILLFAVGFSRPGDDAPDCGRKCPRCS